MTFYPLGPKPTFCCSSSSICMRAGLFPSTPFCTHPCLSSAWVYLSRWVEQLTWSQFFFFSNFQLCWMIHMILGTDAGHECWELSSLARALHGWTETGAFQPPHHMSDFALFCLHLHHPLFPALWNISGLRPRLSDFGCYCGNVSCFLSYCWSRFILKTMLIPDFPKNVNVLLWILYASMINLCLNVSPRSFYRLNTGPSTILLQCLSVCFCFSCPALYFMALVCLHLPPKTTVLLVFTSSSYPLTSTYTY